MPNESTTRLPPEEKFDGPRHSVINVRLHNTGRSITISPPRYRAENGEWRDGVFFADDLPLLIYALQRACDYCYGTPVVNGNKGE